MAKHLLLIILAGLFSGVFRYPPGSKFNSAAVDRIEVGQTTESDVIAMMGRPLSEKKLNNGIRVYKYAYGNRCPIGGLNLKSIRHKYNFIMALLYINGTTLEMY